MFTTKYSGFVICTTDTSLENLVIFKDGWEHNQKSISIRVPDIRPFMDDDCDNGAT